MNCKIQLDLDLDEEDVNEEEIIEHIRYCLTSASIEASNVKIIG